MLTRKLTREEQGQILNVLFGFFFVNVNEKNGGEHWVLYDEEGGEFYGSNENCQFDFSTLAGIFHIQYIGQRIKGIQIANMKCVKCWGFLKLNV